jgi:hypothetical protein
MTTVRFRPLLAVLAALCIAAPAIAADKAAFDSPETEKFVRRLTADLDAKRLAQVDSVSLGREYRANEVAADSKYKGKYLFVKATVESVRKDAFGNIVVMVRSDNQFMPNSVRLDKTVAVITGMENNAKLVSMKTVSAADAAGALTKGQKLRVLCQGDGMLIGGVMLTVCDTISQ